MDRQFRVKELHLKWAVSADGCTTVKMSLIPCLDLCSEDIAEKLGVI